MTVTAKLGEVVHGRTIRLLSDPFANAARCRRLPKRGRMVSLRVLSHQEGSRLMRILWRDAGSVVGSWRHG